MEIPSMADLLRNAAVAGFIEHTLEKVLDHLEIEAAKRLSTVRALLALARSQSCLADYEAQGHVLLRDAGVTSAIPLKLADRAALIHSQVAPHLTGQDICDLGCGDGRVGELIAASGRNVTLTDVYEHPHVASTNLPFARFTQGDPVPLPDNSADTTLLLTVLHHADDPIALLEESIRITRPGGHLILIESVFGISSSQAATVGADAFGTLSLEEQRYTNIFFDHLYNRLIHHSADPANKVNVPFHFNTPENWAALLAQHGAPEQRCIHLGEDQKAVPEYHTLHVGVVDAT
jgi:SAM-dependent methyltransferase